MKQTNGKRALILQAAEGLLRERRVHELTLDEVAEAASVGKGTIYNHFKNKDDLLFQIAMQGFDELCEMVGRLPAEGTFRDRLVGMCGLISQYFEERRAVVRMMQEHETRLRSLAEGMLERWLAHRSRLVNAVALVFAQGIAAGEVRGDIEPDRLATFLLGMMRTRGRDYLLMPENRPTVDLVVDLFLQGAGARTDCDGKKESAGVTERMRIP